MNAAVSMIRPGLMVACKSTVNGGVSYKRIDLDANAVDVVDASAAVSRWETIRVTRDPEEHARAIKARGRALSEIRSQCAATAFGLLCPQDRETILDEAIGRARAIVAEHNASATYTHVSIYTMIGRVASTDEQAARAIGAEVADLLADMSSGIDRLDPKAIRDAADKARQITAMLDESRMGTVTAAIAAARKAARTIVARVEKKAEDAAVVLADIQRGDLEKARLAFLDVTGPADVDVSVTVDAGRFVQLDTDEPIVSTEENAANAAAIMRSVDVG